MKFSLSVSNEMGSVFGLCVYAIDPNKSCHELISIMRVYTVPVLYMFSRPTI